MVNQAVLRNFYVDDLLCSVPTVEIATRTLLDVKDLIARGGFKITKFVSNSEKCIENLCHHDIPSDINSKVIATGIDRTFGLVWKIDTDELHFQVNITPVSTRRCILSVIHGAFDPIGITGPAIIQAKKNFPGYMCSKIRLGCTTARTIRKEMAYVGERPTSLGEIQPTKMLPPFYQP